MGNEPGKISKTDKWTRVRAELKKQFKEWGVTRCEICAGTFALSFAHSKKRRFIYSEDDWREVALLCQSCHDRVEHSGHQKMYETIKDVIFWRTMRVETSDAMRQSFIDDRTVAICEICNYHSFSLDNMTADGRLCLVCWEATNDQH